jgi:hypothetical protein
MAPFVSSEVDGGNRWKAPAPDPAMEDIAVEGTAAADTAADRDTATPGFVAARVFGCIVPVQQSKAPGRREGIGSGNNPNRPHASANTPPPGLECASCWLIWLLGGESLRTRGHRLSARQVSRKFFARGFRFDVGTIYDLMGRDYSDVVILTNQIKQSVIGKVIGIEYSSLLESFPNQSFLDLEQ